MNVDVGIDKADTLSIEIQPDENDLECWTMLAMLSALLWRDHGLELDCDTIVVTLVYGSANEEARQRPRSSTES